MGNAIRGGRFIHSLSIVGVVLTTCCAQELPNVAAALPPLPSPSNTRTNNPTPSNSPTGTVSISVSASETPCPRYCEDRWCTPWCISTAFDVNVKVQPPRPESFFSLQTEASASALTDACSRWQGCPGLIEDLTRPQWMSVASEYARLAVCRSIECCSSDDDGWNSKLSSQVFDDGHFPNLAFKPRACSQLDLPHDQRVARCQACTALLEGAFKLWEHCPRINNNIADARCAGVWDAVECNERQILLRLPVHVCDVIGCCDDVRPNELITPSATFSSSISPSPPSVITRTATVSPAPSFPLLLLDNRAVRTARRRF